MKKYRLIFCLAMVIVSLLVVMGGSVQAATPPDTNVNSVAVQNLYSKLVQAKGQDFDSFYAKLSTADQQLAISILTPASSEVTKTPLNSQLMSPMDTGLQFAVTTNLYDIYHLLIAQYSQGVTWYFNGTIITQPPGVAVAGNTDIIGWTYKGVLYQSQMGGQYYSYFTAYSQGSFNLTVLGITVSTWYPAILQNVYANGTDSYQTWQ
jgi:hypothetical protein